MVRFRGCAAEGFDALDALRDHQPERPHLAVDFEPPYGDARQAGLTAARAGSMCEKGCSSECEQAFA